MRGSVGSHPGREIPRDVHESCGPPVEDADREDRLHAGYDCAVEAAVEREELDSAILVHIAKGRTEPSASRR